MDALSSRCWKIPASEARKISVSTSSSEELSSLLHAAALPSHVPCLRAHALWQEVSLLKRLIYKNNSQHRGSSFMHGIREVLRSLNSLNELSLPQIIDDLHVMVSIASGSGSRQVHRLPSRETCAWVLSRLLLGCVILQGLPEIIATKAAAPLAAQLASSLFMPLCSGLLAILARVRALGMTLLIDVTRAYNSIVQLIPLLPSSHNPTDNLGSNMSVLLTSEIVKGLKSSYSQGKSSNLKIVRVVLSDEPSSSSSSPLWTILPQMLACQPIPVPSSQPSAAKTSVPSSQPPGTRGSNEARSLVPSVSIVTDGSREYWEQKAVQLWDDLGLVQYSVEEQAHPISTTGQAIKTALSPPPLLTSELPSAQPVAPPPRPLLLTIKLPNEPIQDRQVQGLKRKAHQPSSATTVAPSKPSGSSFFETMGSSKGSSLGLRVFEDKGKGSSSSLLGGSKKRRKGSSGEGEGPSNPSTGSKGGSSSLLGLEEILASPLVLAPVYTTHGSFSLGLSSTPQKQ